MESCTCSSATGLIFSCSGGSNVGQITNQAAVELTKAKTGKMYFLAGVGGHIESFTDSSREARNVVIDGCPVSCAKKIFEHAEIPISEYIVVTELDIKKNPNLDPEEKDIERVCCEVKNRLG